QFVSVGQRVRQRGGLLQDRPDRGALALKGRDELTGQRVHVRGVQCVEEWPETADQRVEVQGRRGPIERDRLSGSQFGGSAGTLFEGQVPASDEIVVADDRAASLCQHHRSVSAELDQYGGIVPDTDVLDLAHFDTGDTNEVAVLQTGHRGEDRVIGVLFLKAQL